jgi:hypothetical protein
VSATDILLFDERDTTAALRRRALSAAFEMRLADAWTLSAGAGASLGGYLTVNGLRHDLEPGPVGSLAGAYRILDGREEHLPFLLFGVAFSGSTVVSEASDASATRARLTALDFRASLTVGKVFLDALAPYATVRGFGGPIFWELDGQTVGGTDQYHFQVGAGAIVTAGIIDAFVEVIPLGERAVTVGGAVSF